ncbi:MAG TPA: response regulator transcription factor [Pyrinomonadaceae bacterium]|jgi:DNA-binding NarL/FixJ family response regulator|nr:response regulator transcription factor [Pyrinomonadaceae bacterium]
MKNILLVDDHEVVRAGIKRIFDKQPGLVTFGEASTAAEAFQRVREQDWDIVVLDLSLGGRDGLEVLKEIKQVRPKLPVLILSMHAEELFARRALKAGADGYVTKSSSRAELATAINKVSTGGHYVSPALAERLVIDLRRDQDHAPHELLSDREFEVMRLIASGKTVSEVADLLKLSVGTISTYRARILEKMSMRTNAELTHYAIQNKLVD